MKMTDQKTLDSQLASLLNAGLAANIARHIFECGDEPDHKVKRIQFMTGKWPDDEISLGGLNENALRNIIERSLAANVILRGE